MRSSPVAENDAKRTDRDDPFYDMSIIAGPFFLSIGTSHPSPPRTRASHLSLAVLTVGRTVGQRGEAHVAVLTDILVTYEQYNQNIKYLQGMNELAGTFYKMTGDETEGFWWFHGFMESYVSRARRVPRLTSPHPRSVVHLFETHGWVQKSVEHPRAAHRIARPCHNGFPSYACLPVIVPSSPSQESTSSEICASACAGSSSSSRTTSPTKPTSCASSTRY